MAEARWGGYANGQIPLDALSVVNYPRVTPNRFEGSLDAVYMEPTAGLALTAWLVAFHDKFGSYLGVNEGYRTLAGQRYWWSYWKQNPAKAAEPGTSNHGWGQAVDFVQGDLGTAALAWLRSTCSTYGFAPYVNENWHFDYKGGYVPPTNPGNEDMATYELMRAKGQPEVFYCVDRMFRIHITEVQLADYKYFITSKGQDATIKEVASPSSFGIDVTP